MFGVWKCWGLGNNLFCFSLNIWMLEVSGIPGSSGNVFSGQKPSGHPKIHRFTSKARDRFIRICCYGLIRWGWVLVFRLPDKGSIASAHLMGNVAALLSWLRWRLVQRCRTAPSEDGVWLAEPTLKLAKPPEWRQMIIAFMPNHHSYRRRSSGPDDSHPGPPADKKAEFRKHQRTRRR